MRRSTRDVLVAWRRERHRAQGDDARWGLCRTDHRTRPGNRRYQRQRPRVPVDVRANGNRRNGEETMTTQLRRRMLACAGFTVAAALATTPVSAEMSAEELAKLVAESGRQSDQRAVPEQHQSQLRAGQGNAEHPQHPAGDSDLGERRLERHHAHDPASNLEPVAGSRRRRHHRHRRHDVDRIRLPRQARAVGSGVPGPSSSYPRTATRNWATRTGASEPLSWCCTSTRGTRGSTGC